MNSFPLIHNMLKLMAILIDAINKTVGNTSTNLLTQFDVKKCTRVNNTLTKIIQITRLLCVHAILDYCPHGKIEWTEIRRSCRPLNRATPANPTIGKVSSQPLTHSRGVVSRAAVLLEPPFLRERLTMRPQHSVQHVKIRLLIHISCTPCTLKTHARVCLRRSGGRRGRATNSRARP